MKRRTHFLGVTALMCFACAAVVRAQDPVFDAKGFQQNRDYFSQMPFEHLDTLTGSLVLTFTDLALPGNAGHDLRFTRTYNSKDGRWSYGIGGAVMRVNDSGWVIRSLGCSRGGRLSFRGAHTAIRQGATMDVSGVSSVSASGGMDTSGSASSTHSSPDDLFNAPDEQLMALAAEGITEAILELEKRDAARVAGLPATENQHQTAFAATVDTPAILGWEKPDAAQAAKLLASADDTVFAAAEEAVGNIVDKIA